jgi:hypothetical protein
MAKIPKYKTIPFYAYKYAKRNGILSDEHEKVFIKNPPMAIEYATVIKRKRLVECVENEVCNFYYEATKKIHDCDRPARFFESFFNYLKLVKSIPKEYEEKFLNSFSEDFIVKYAMSLDKRIEKKYEDKLLLDAVKRGKIGYLVEYSYAIGSKLPEDMHNFVISHAMKNSDDFVIKSYLNNLKNLKKTLSKLSCVFGDNKTIKEIINQL